MKPVLKWMKYIFFIVVIAALLCASGPVMLVNANSGAINVTDYKTGELLYSGDDLQEAFDAAQNMSIVSVARYITMTQDVVVKSAVMLRGYSFIRFVPDTNDTSVYYKLQLAGEGMLYVDTRIRTKYIAALHEYSSVTVEQYIETNGYVYYLESQAPAFSAARPVVSAGDGVYGGKVDQGAEVIYLDIASNGATQTAVAQCITMHAENTEQIHYSFQAPENGSVGVATGATMVATATNYDSKEKAELSYTVILLGDVNGNGIIDSADATLIAQFATGSISLDDYALLAADANMDGVVNARDAKFICEKYVRADTYRSPLQQ